MQGGEYEGVKTERELMAIDMDFFREVQSISAEEQATEKGDMLDGLIVGLDMLVQFCGKKKYRKRVFLITDGEKEAKFTKREMNEIIKTINGNDIKLNCITIDFCNDLDESDSDQDPADQQMDHQKVKKESGESEAQLKNKAFLTQIQDKTGCAIIPAETAIELYQQFKKKEYLSRTKYRGNLDISADLKLGVQIFTKTREESLPTLKKYSKNVPDTDFQGAGKIIVEKTFAEVDDPDQNRVDESQHAKAFQYGKQLVPVSAENEDALKLGGKAKKEENSGSQTPKGDDDIKMQQNGIERQFKLLGFTDMSNVPRHHFMAGVDVILPIKGAKNERAFAAMVYSMLETNKVLLAKIIERKNADPKLVVLHPYVSKKQPLLYLVQLPTAEDLRDYQFPSLVQATNRQREAAKKLIQKLDLCPEEVDSDGEVEQTEKLEVEKTFNPTIQYFNQVVTHKVVNPQRASELPAINPVIKEYLEQEKELHEEANEEIEEFEQAFELVQNEEDKEDAQKKQRVTWKDIIEREEQKQRELQIQEEGIPMQAAPLTEEEAARLKEHKPDDEDPDAVKEVGSVNPIEDFKKMISDRKTDRVSSALKQMQAVIEKFIRSSLNGDLYDKAFDCLQAMRNAAVSEDEAPTFNTFMHKVKDSYSSGVHSGFFEKLKKAKFSLIRKDESEISSVVTKPEAESFLQVDVIKPKAPPKPKAKEQDDFDLLD